jgi:23S rRNA G2069 N7-methylase RlmK/C1962 C5-methylase RlmI
LKRSPQSKSFRNGNQLVFSKAIQQVDSNNRTVTTGTLVEVLVEADSPGPPMSLGYGVYNTHSLYRIRFLCHRYVHTYLYTALRSTCTTADAAMALILRHHVRAAVQGRRALSLPTANTDTYRLINGEGDHLSGLAVDMIRNVAVVMSSAAWCQIHAAAIRQALEAELPVGTEIVWKTTTSRLEQDGYTVASAVKETAVVELQEEEEGKEQPMVEERVVISTENSIQYETFPYATGQKTGVYCDQRENRCNVAQLCAHKRVLDLCCYHGGFSLNAAIHGPATFCTGVDSSAEAIAISERNARLNQCEDRTEFIRADITAYLQEAYRQKQTYDVIVLDPPKLAPSTASLDKARRKYHAFNRDAIKLIDPNQGGLLFTCTCSAAMTQRDGGRYFLDMVHTAALAAGRSITLMRVSGAAGCHTQSPMAWPAGAYLTTALFYVHPMTTQSVTTTATTANDIE